MQLTGDGKAKLVRQVKEKLEQGDVINIPTLTLFLIETYGLSMTAIADLVKVFRTHPNYAFDYYNQSLRKKSVQELADDAKVMK